GPSDALRGLQSMDTRGYGRVRGEHGADGARAGYSGRLECLGQFAGLDSAQPGQCPDHGFARAQQIGRAGVGTVFTLTREPCDDYRCQYAEDDFAGYDGDV